MNLNVQKRWVTPMNWNQLHNSRNDFLALDTLPQGRCGLNLEDMSNNKNQLGNTRLSPVVIVATLTLVNLFIALFIVLSGVESDIASKFMAACGCF